MSPRQASVIVAGANDRLVREHNELVWLAWHIAALQRAKRLPRLKTLLAKPASQQRLNWQQQMAVMDQWVVHTQRVARQRKKLTGPKKK